VASTFPASESVAADEQPASVSKKQDAIANDAVREDEFAMRPSVP
jgi:hypothetical protein